MEIIPITVDEFLANVAPGLGLLPSLIEGQLKNCLSDPLGPLPWSIFARSDKKYVIAGENIRSYFDAKTNPKPVKSADAESFKDFMETPVNPAPPEKTKPSKSAK
jgi:hypothetical protein